MQSLDIRTAKNAMSVIADGAASGAFEALGITEDEFQTATGDFPWISSDRHRVTAVLDALTHGTIDVLGLPRIEVPAEYRAAVIAMFVSPLNQQVACRWLEAGFDANMLAAGGKSEPVSAKQLFACVCMISPDSAPLRARWDKRVNRALRLVTEETAENA